MPVMEAIFNKVAVLQKRIYHRRLPVSCSNTSLWLLLNIEPKCSSLNDDIVWWKYSRIVKDLSSDGRFGTKLIGFYSPYEQSFSVPLVVSKSFGFLLFLTHYSETTAIYEFFVITN